MERRDGMKRETKGDRTRGGENSVPRGLSDLHLHPQNAPDSETLRAVFHRAWGSGVRRLVCSATSPRDWESVRRIVTETDRSIKLIPTFGIHPWSIREFPDKDAINAGLERLDRFLDSIDRFAKKGDEVPGIGEIGLDFALRDLSEGEKERQRHLFRGGLAIADRRKVPVVIHQVRSASEIFADLRDFSGIPLILFHRFVVNPEILKRMSDERFFFSFSPYEIRPGYRKGREAVAILWKTRPDRFLLETDYPSTGVEPGDLPRWVDKFAEVVGISPRDFLVRLQENETGFFHRWPKQGEVGLVKEDRNSGGRITD